MLFVKSRMSRTLGTRVRITNFGFSNRIRYQVLSASPVNYVTEANVLADLIKQMSV